MKEVLTIEMFEVSEDHYVSNIDLGYSSYQESKERAYIQAIVLSIFFVVSMYLIYISL